MFKKLPLILSLLLITNVLFSQLSINEMLGIKLGSTFSNIKAKQNIIQSFKSEKLEYSVWKGDFYNAHKITFENFPFDYYGEADYTFQYVKDTLSHLEVEYIFPAYKLTQFNRFIKQLVSDLNGHPQLMQPNYGNTLNIENVIRVGEKECKENLGIFDVNTRLLGGRTWVVKNAVNNTSTRLRVEVSLQGGERSFKQPFGSALKRYSGAWMKVRVIFLNDKMIDLFIVTESGEDVNYKQVETYYDKKLFTWDVNGNQIIKESSNNIKLKDHNGVYALPVNLNKVMTIDFVLDLGASDVSISPDVFMVLYKAGTISEEDFIGNETYQLADGSTVKSDIINLKSLTIGGKEINNIRASISKSLIAPLLLGQSALKKLSSYRVNVDTKTLIIE